MTIDPNPFAPPRDEAVGGDPPALVAAPAWPADALDEIARREPWARWVARLASVSLMVGAAKSAAVLVRSNRAEVRAVALTAALGLLLAALSAWMLDRCARRLRVYTAGDPVSLMGVLRADRAYLRAMSIAGLGLLVVLVGLLSAVIMAAARGTHP